MTAWFVSDTHFGHKNIIRLCNRPFKTVEEMDEVMIANWNNVVDKGDTVYHLGDFAFRSSSGVGTYRKRLNGEIHLVYGNHDKWAHRLHGPAVGFASISVYKEIEIAGQNIILCHYAFRTWNKKHYGSWNLHGHSHGKLPRDPGSKQLDMGVDVWGFRPVSFFEIGCVMNTIENVPVDHHGEEDGTQDSESAR